MIFGVEKSIFGLKKVEKLLDPHISLYNYRFVRLHQICSEQYGLSKQGNL